MTLTSQRIHSYSITPRFGLPERNKPSHQGLVCQNGTNHHTKGWSARTEQTGKPTCSSCRAQIWLHLEQGVRGLRKQDYSPRNAASCFNFHLVNLMRLQLTSGGNLRRPYASRESESSVFGNHMLYFRVHRQCECKDNTSKTRVNVMIKKHVSL